MIPAEAYNNIGELLQDGFVQYKTRVGLIEARRHREVARLEYREIATEVGRLAAWLAAQGVGPGDRVAIIMSNQSKWLIGAAAVFYRGAVLVPLDYKLTADEHQSLIAHAQPKLLVMEYGYWRPLRDIEGPPVLITEAPDGEDIGTAYRWEDIPEGPGWGKAEHRERDDVATIVYSSGTGGDPKGCMLSHGAYLSQLGALLAKYPMGEGDRYFSILPTNHAIDFMCGFLGPFACGATVVHQRTLRPEFILSSMQRYRVTHMAVVPLLLKAFERNIRERIEEQAPWKRRMLDMLIILNESLTDTTPRHGVSRTLLKPIHDAFGGQLRVLFCGGAFVDPDLASFFHRLGLPVIIGYGLTEACTVVSVNDMVPYRGDSVGRPVDGVEVRITDPNEEGIGEVYVSGPTIMQGYLDDEAQTTAAFDGAWLKTGDLGYVDASGHLHLVGRRKNMIVTPGGKNIYPEDIEAAFSDVPCEEFAVYAANYIWPKQTLIGESLIAILRRDQDEAQDVGEVIAQLNRRLPDFKRVSGVLYWEDTFPRTASMKLKRGVLAEQVRNQCTQDRVENLGVVAHG